MYFTLCTLLCRCIRDSLFCLVKPSVELVGFPVIVMNQQPCEETVHCNLMLCELWRAGLIQPPKIDYSVPFCPYYYYKVLSISSLPPSSLSLLPPPPSPGVESAEGRSCML